MRNKMNPYKAAGAAIAAAFLALSAGCQFARVHLTPPTPRECLVPISADPGVQDEYCSRAYKKFVQADGPAAKNGKKTKVIKQKFYFWGLMPRVYYVNSGQYCKRGVSEVVHYTDWMDDLLGSVTLGIYWPRTLKLVCF